MRRLSCLILSMVLFALVLAACGDPTATTAPVATTTAAAATTAAATTTTAATTAAAATTTAASPAVVFPAVKPSGLTGKIVWWHITTLDPGKSVWQGLADTYTKANPGVTIEVNVLENEAFKSKLATAMQSGSPPDLFQSWGGGVLQQYAKAGLVKDITNDLKGAWGDSFNKAPLDVYGADGKTYGVPWDMGAVGFWYNKALFQKAGITAPPQTWTQFKDAVTKLKTAGITPIALGEKDQWPGAFYWEYLATRVGGKAAFDKAYSRTGGFSDTAYIEAGKKLQELVALDPFQKGFLGTTYNDHSALVGNGLAAMELMGQWAPDADKGNSANKLGQGDNLAFFPFPMVEGGAGDPTDVLGGGNGIAVGKNAAPVAVDFLKYLTSVDTQKLLAAQGMALPVVKGAETSISSQQLKNVQEMVKNAKYFQLYYDQYLPPAMGSVVNEATAGIFAGSLPPDAAAKSIESSAASELKK